MSDTTIDALVYCVMAAGPIGFVVAMAIDLTRERNARELKRREEWARRTKGDVR